MDSPDPAWRGLWHASPPGRWRDEMVVRAAVYLTPPLALALLFGEVDSASQFGRAYLGALIVGSSITASFELIYHFVWPRLFRRRPGWPARIAGHALTLLAAVGGGVMIATWIVELALGWCVQLPRMWLQGGVVSTVIVSILVAADEMSAQARDLERREATLRVSALRAELAALQARTDPHFLFNSLNTVAALIPDDPRLAETLLERLATVFRYALEAGRRATVALADELAAVTAYLEVESLRLGPRLRWRLDRAGLSDAELAAVRVPPLVLQPLAENAVRHGAGGRREPTLIVVTVRRVDAELVLAVEDHAATAAAPVVATAVTGGAGTALRDLEARLDLAYGGRARFHAGAAPPAGWRAEVVLPMAGLP